MVIELLPCCNLNVKLHICRFFLKVIHRQDFWIQNLTPKNYKKTLKSTSKIPLNICRFLRSILTILHLTELFTQTLSVVRDKYEICADADDEDVENGNDNNDDIIPCCKLCCRSQNSRQETKNPFLSSGGADCSNSWNQDSTFGRLVILSILKILKTFAVLIFQCIAMVMMVIRTMAMTEGITMVTPTVAALGTRTPPFKKFI